MSSISPDAGAAEPFAHTIRDWASYLAAAGLTARAPLPGAQARPLADSCHVATLDNDGPEIFDSTLAFIRDHVRAQTQ